MRIMGQMHRSGNLQRRSREPLENGTYSITNPSTNKVLSVDGSSTADGANVYVTGNQNLSSQRFELTYLVMDTIKFFCRTFRKVIGYSSRNSASGSEFATI